MTSRCKVHFVVKVFPDGTPWIVIEPLDGDLLGDGDPRAILGFDLTESITAEEAIALAKHLDDHIVNLAYTKTDS